MATIAAPGRRYPSLDAIRGIAVMGILLMNIVGFAMPLAAYSNPFAYGYDGVADIAAWAINFIVADGKMRGLFALLFGASMLLVIERAEAAGDGAARVHFARMGWLFVFGILHAYAIWHGDILLGYAAIGCVAYLFRRMAPHKLIVLGLSLILGQAMFWGVTAFEVWALREAASSPGAAPATVAQWDALAAAYAPPPPGELARDLALYRSGYGDISGARLGAGFWLPIRANFYTSFETLGYMLAGMAGLKGGFLTGRWPRRSYALLARRGYLVGLPLSALVAWLLFRSGFSPVPMLAFDFALQTLVTPIVVFAHAALILLWVTRAAGSALVARIAAAGRAAFTNYLGTSLVMTTLFYGYGLGLYGALGRAELYVLVPGAWALMLLWSKPWLDRFRYGPLEWLWRSLARGRLQPLRK